MSTDPLNEIEETITAYNEEMSNSAKRAKTDVESSYGGLAAITEVIRGSYVYLDAAVATSFEEELGYYCECYPLAEFVECNNIEMVNINNEYIDALYLVLLPSFRKDEIKESVWDSVLSTVKALGLTKGLKEENTIVIEFGDISYDEFRRFLVTTHRDRVGRLYNDAKDMLYSENESTGINYDSCFLTLERGLELASSALDQITLADARNVAGNKLLQKLMKARGPTNVGDYDVTFIPLPPKS